MATNFPSSLDDSTTIPVESANTKLSTNHVTAHQNIQDAIEAIEAKVGADSSAVTTSHDYKLGEVTSTDKAVGKTATQTLTNKTLTTPVINIGSDAEGDTYYRTSGGAFTRLARGTDNYIYKMNGNVPNWEAETVTVNASTTAAGIVEVATAAEINAGTGTGGTGAVLSISPDNLATTKYFPKFGGDGSDGALTLTSGATNIDLGSSAFVVKNYTSISITGTGSLTFTNPHTNGTVIILKSQGDVTLTSSTAPMIDASAMGGAGGAGAATSSGSADGANGSNGVTTILVTDAGNGGDGDGTAVGTGGTGTVFSYSGAALTTTRQKYTLIPVASGGGGGATNGGIIGGTSGAGGRGGGTLIIECAGAFNFTTTSGISVAGTNGGTGTGASSGSAGGGGGAGGYFCAIYNTLTANSGTVTVTGGTGGNKSADNVYTTYGGGGGASNITVGSAGASSSAANAKTGGDGAAGTSVVLKNLDF